MKNYFLKLVASPIVHFNIITVELLIVIGSLHNHAHYQMSNDPDAYVYQWCKANPERCTYRPK
jgi:hypothetical protein